MIGQDARRIARLAFATAEDRPHSTEPSLLEHTVHALQAGGRQRHHGSITTCGQAAFAFAALSVCDAALSNARLGRIRIAKTSSRPNGATTSRRSSSANRTPTACTSEA